MRTPHGIANEVGKILHVAMFIEKQIKNNAPAFSFSSKQSKKILNGLNGVFANTIRKEFKHMNKKWKFYDEKEEIKLNDFDLLNQFTMRSNLATKQF